MITEKLGADGDHPRLQGLDAFYEADIAPHLAQFEAARKKAWAKAPWVTLPLAVALLGLALQNDWLAIAGGAVGVLIAIYIASEISNAKGSHTVFVASRVCGFLGLTYSEHPKVNLVPWFRSLGLVPSFDRKSLEDGISGEVEDTHLEVQEVELEERRTRRDSKGRRQTYYVTVFKGLLIAATFPKRFKSTTIISTDSGLFNFFTGLGKSGERARLEDPRFEDRFEVHTTDQVECRYLLTPTFMERLVALDERFDGKLQAAFDEDRFLLSIRSRQSWFEAEGQSADLRDPTAVVDMVRDVTMLFDLVEQLNLSAKTKV